MARLIKAVARCGLRFESGLPLGRVQRKGSAASEGKRGMEGGRGRERERERECSILTVEQRG